MDSFLLILSLFLSVAASPATGPIVAIGTDPQPPVKKSTVAPASILGTWKLQSFVKVATDGKESAWCKGPFGLASYTVQGYMSVSINCDKETSEDAPGKDFQNKMLFAGQYELKARTDITYHVSNSSQIDWIGHDLSRHIESISSDTLVLSERSDAGTFRSTWTRIRRK